MAGPSDTGNNSSTTPTTSISSDVYVNKDRAQELWIKLKNKFCTEGQLKALIKDAINELVQGS